MFEFSVGRISSLHLDLEFAESPLSWLAKILVLLHSQVSLLNQLRKDMGNFTQEALYSQLAQLGIPSSNLVRSSLSNESVSSSFQLGSYPQVVSTWPGMSSTGMCSLLYSSRTPAPAFLQPNLATANSFDSRPGGTCGNRYGQ